MITTSEVAISLTIDDVSHLEQIVKELDVLGTVEVDHNLCIICIVGNKIAESKGVIKSVMDALVEFPLRMVSYGGSRHNVSILVDEQYKIDALKRLNSGLFNFL